MKRGPFTEEEDKEILAAHAVYGNKWAVISRGIPGRYGRDARAPRHTPKPRFNTLGTDSRDSVRSFRRADAEPSFRRSRTPHGIFARFLKNPPRGSSDSWENLARGFSVSLFRQSDECLFFPDRDALEIERASIGRDARRFRFRVRVTDGQTRAERTARALPHTSDDMSRPTSDDD